MIAALGLDPKWTAVAILLVILAGLIIAGRTRTRSDAPKGAAQRSTTEPTERIVE